jgi:hypothetical protein
MPHRVVDLHPGTVEDIPQARDWYHSRDETAARAFFSEIEGALGRIVGVAGALSENESGQTLATETFSCGTAWGDMSDLTYSTD